MRTATRHETGRLWSGGRQRSAELRKYPGEERKGKGGRVRKIWREGETGRVRQQVKKIDKAGSRRT